VTWLTWRLQRTELILLGLMLLGLSGVLVATHADLVAESKQYTAETCPGPLVGTEQGCFVEVSWLYQIVNEGLLWLNFLPLIAALLLALPIVTELESGSYRLAWTQGITRGQWTRTKFGVVALCGVMFAAIFALAFHWWSSPRDEFYGRLGQDDYDFRGIVPIGHTIFAVGLMLGIGVLMKRPIPALALASVAYVGLRIPFVQSLRPRLITPVKEPDAEFYTTNARHLWFIDSYWQDAAGNRLENSEVFDFCFPRGVNPTRELQNKCVADNGLVHYQVYHPESHYWPLQLVETALFLGVGIALIGFAAWYILRRVE
jgi:hypothetical protein